jgi:archaellum component FlaC
MKKAIEIKSELDKTDSRITELENELTAQTASFEGVQQAFVEGRSDVNQLHAEQSKITLLSQAINALKATYQKLKSTFENQSADERRSELLERMRATANEVEPLVNDYLTTRTEFHEIMSKYAQKLIDKAEAYRAKQIEYRTIISELEPTDAEIQETGLDQRTRTMAAATYFNHLPIEYGEVITQAENLLAAKINKAAAAKRTAQFSALNKETPTAITKF